MVLAQWTVDISNANYTIYDNYNAGASTGASIKIYSMGKVENEYCCLCSVNISNNKITQLTSIQK